MKVYSLCLGVSFYSSLPTLPFIFNLSQKVRNLQIGIEKLVGKVVINIMLNNQILEITLMVFNFHQKPLRTSLVMLSDVQVKENIKS